MPVSIRARRFRAGRRPAIGAGWAYQSFQSAPDAFAPGDLKRSEEAGAVSGFQSAPDAFAPGDFSVSVNSVADKIVSIRARRFRAGRLLDSQYCGVPQRFNPRPTLSRRATPIADTWSCYIGVSIRARRFRAGRLAAPLNRRSVRAVSIRARRFRAGRLVVLCSRTTNRPVFQSAPDAFAPGDRQTPPVSSYAFGFNPRPTLSRRATRDFLNIAHRSNVSMRARRFRAGRPRAKAGLSQSQAFQSAPDAFAPGDRSPFTGPPHSAKFQSAPDAFAPGDCCGCYVAPHHLVSIRARRFRAGRHAHRVRKLAYNGFQSAPDAFAPGDLDAASLPAVAASFNPRPTLSRRATRAPHLISSTLECFNPRPTLSRRATLREINSSAVVSVFQSAPDAFAPGDSAGQAFERTETSFNPRPTLSRRATSARIPAALALAVSIRARRFRAGRPCSVPAVAVITMFQSAPDAFAPGD